MLISSVFFPDLSCRSPFFPPRRALCSPSPFGQPPARTDVSIPASPSPHAGMGLLSSQTTQLKDRVASPVRTLALPGVPDKLPRRFCRFFFSVPQQDDHLRPPSAGGSSGRSRSELLVPSSSTWQVASSPRWFFGTLFFPHSFCRASCWYVHSAVPRLSREFLDVVPERPLLQADLTFPRARP